MLNFLLFFLYNSLVTRRCYINDETPSRILFKNQGVRATMLLLLLLLLLVLLLLFLKNQSLIFPEQEVSREY